MVDDIDRGVLDALRVDGRLPLESLGRAVGLSGDAARDRLARLTRDGIVRVAGRVNQASLGLTTMGLAMFRVVGDTVERQAQRLAVVPEYDLVMSTIGMYDLVVEVVCRDIDELARSLDEHLRSYDQVRDLVFVHYLDTFTYKPGGLNAQPLTAHDPGPLQPEDVAIAEILQQDGRASYREIADRCGQPYQRVRRRVAHLLGSGMLQIETIVNDAALGRAVEAVVSVRVEGPLRPVCDAIAAMAGIDMGVVTTGEADILLSVSCHDRASLVATVTDTIRRVPGVTTTETSLIVRNYKLGLPWRGLAD